MGVTAHGWPNERTNNYPPSNAVDGDISTCTYTTQAYTNVKPCWLGLDFGSVQAVNRIRLWKDDEGGWGVDDPKDLVIQYTTDLGPMASRTWQNVANLSNGFGGTELLQATSVNSDGTVVGDEHDSVYEGHGWASLKFSTVAATGVAVGFSTRTTVHANHYKVHEFEAHVETVPVGSGTWGKIKALYTAEN
jgi:hypothetical protein